MKWRNDHCIVVQTDIGDACLEILGRIMNLGLRGHSFFESRSFAASVCLVGLLGPWTARAQVQTIRQFGYSVNGAEPTGPLLINSSGVIFGVTESGGSGSCSSGNDQGCGLVYSLTPPASGSTGWVLKDLAKFGTAKLPGYFPLQGLTTDKAGNLFGTTLGGGSQADCGTIFQVIPPAAGKTAWGAKVIYTFSNASGYGPQGGSLSIDANGNLYGTTPYGGPNEGGVVYELVRPAKATEPWTYKILHAFGQSGDSQDPFGTLVFDSAGNIYGAASGGPTPGNIYELSPPAAAGEAWTEKVLYTFAFNGDPVGYGPTNVIFDGKGGLIGTTFYGAGNDGSPTLFDLQPPAAGTGPWMPIILATVPAMHDLSWVGTTIYGSGGGYDAIYKIAPQKSGGYAITTFYTTTHPGGSSSGVVPGLDGYVYGTLEEGGTSSFGSVFRFLPK